MKVWPYWAYTYNPDPFQPKALSDEQNEKGELTRCPGFEDDEEHYVCRPAPQDWSNCWKCPPKDPFGGGYTAYSAVRHSHLIISAGALHRLAWRNGDCVVQGQTTGADALLRLSFSCLRLQVSKVFAAHWKDLQIPVLEEVGITLLTHGLLLYERRIADPKVPFFLL